MLKSLHLRLLSVITLMLCGLGVSWADEVEFDSSSQGYNNSTAITSVVVDPITFTFDNGSNSTNAPKYYTTGTAIRCYSGNTITVSCDASRIISGITFTFGSSDGSNTITSDVGTFKTSTWTGASSSITFTIGGTSGNRRIQKIKVTYQLDNEPSIAVNSASIDLDDVYEGEATDTKTLEVTPANLTADITYSLGEGASSPFSVTGTLNKTEASTLTIALNSTATVGDYSDVLTITSGTTSTKVNLSAKVNAKVTSITVEAAQKVYIGKMIDLGATVNSGATLSYSSSDTDVATVDASGIVTGVAAGTATITITAPVYNGWSASTTDVVITVTEQPDYIFYESFDENKTYGGGNDEKWNSISNTATIICDNSGWTFVKGYSASTCVRFGTAKDQGSAQTPKLALVEGTQDCKLTFKAGAWDASSEQTTLNLSVTGGGTLSESSVTLTKGAWTNYTIYITGATSNTQITFEAANASNNRFFLDEVLIKEYGNEVVSLSSVGYATLYYGEKNLVVPEGIEAYTYTVTEGKLEESWLYEKDDVIPAGTGVVLKGAEGSYTFVASKESGEPDEDNMLHGSDVAAETTGGAKYYKLSLNAENAAGSVGFYWGAEDGAAFTSAAHKAYLAIPAGGGASSAPSFFLFEDNATAINGVENAQNVQSGKCYNLAGQKVSSDFRGIVIVNGKKVVK